MRAAHPIAFLQYTSGSTSAPRGVVLTHESIAVFCQQAATVYRETTDDVAVTWVPLYHDMGLVTGVLRPLHTGYHSVLLRPDAFVSAPASWLDAVANCGGTLASAPNFAYDLCVRKVDAAAVAQRDLSRWRVARTPVRSSRRLRCPRSPGTSPLRGFVLTPCVPPTVSRRRR